MTSETPSVTDSLQLFHGDGFDQTYDTVTSVPVHEYQHAPPYGFDNLARDLPARSPLATECESPPPRDDSNQVAEESIHDPTQVGGLNYGVTHQQPVADKGIHQAPENQWFPEPQFTGDSEISEYMHKIIDVFWGSNAAQSQQSINSNSGVQPEGSNKTQPPGESAVTTPPPGSTRDSGDHALGPDSSNGLSSTAAGELYMAGRHLDNSSLVEDTGGGLPAATVRNHAAGETDSSGSREGKDTSGSPKPSLGLMKPTDVWKTLIEKNVPTAQMVGLFFPEDQKHVCDNGGQIHCKAGIKITITAAGPEWETIDCKRAGLRGISEYRRHILEQHLAVPRPDKGDSGKGILARLLNTWAPKEI